MYWKVTNLLVLLREGVCGQSGRAVVHLHEPNEECSGAPHWPVGCGSLTGLGAFEYAGTIREE